MTPEQQPKKQFDLLSRLVLMPTGNALSAATGNLTDQIARLSHDEFDSLSTLAGSNHVLMRGMQVFRSLADQAGDSSRRDWADVALTTEKLRIDNAVAHLAKICDAFFRRKLDVAVIKSFDHLPDLGSDLDLYTNAPPEDVIRLMREEFGAGISSRSWGDRLACKWNFEIPGLPELVEVHMGRLGQTGEQSVIAQSLLARTRNIPVHGRMFRVPGASDRLMISTLQRMYRHFYFRLCDVVDSAELVESGILDWNDLRNAASAAAIWEGVATYLAIVTEYVRSYRGSSIGVPQWVLDSARFSGKKVYFAKDFLRVPVVPQSAMLYGTQLASVLSRRQIKSSARLSLLPWLATAALVGQKITGSDKGIW